MSGRGPENEVFDSIWSDERSGGLLTFQVGEVTVSATEIRVWFPFLVLAVVVGVTMVVVLPADLLAAFADLAFYWVRLSSGDVSTLVWVSLVADAVALILVFVLYTRAYAWVIEFALGRVERR